MKRSDAEAAAFAAGVELAAITLYREAVGTRRLDQAAAAVCDHFMRHHSDHAASFNALLDQPLAGDGNASILAMFRRRLDEAKNQRAVLDVAHVLEEMMAATHLGTLDVLADPAAAASAATIHGVECQHAVVLGTILGRSLDQLCPDFATAGSAFDPGTFPA